MPENMDLHGEWCMCVRCGGTGNDPTIDVRPDAIQKRCFECGGTGHKWELVWRPKGLTPPPLPADE